MSDFRPFDKKPRPHRYGIISAKWRITVKKLTDELNKLKSPLDKKRKSIQTYTEFRRVEKRSSC